MKRDLQKQNLPKFDDLMNPTVHALKRLGGSASVDELMPEIVKLLNLPQQVAEVPHGNTGRTELEYRRLGLARTSETPGLSRTPSAACGL